MKHVMTAAALIAASLFSLPSQAANVGVSISVGQPGFYGQIDIGGYPPPQVVYPQPVVIQPAPVAMPPLYLRVPPAHMQHWSRYCREYHACGRRVFFVRDDWYSRVYVPHYQQRHFPHHDGYEHRDHHEEHRDEHRDYPRDR